jgi:hypothetical protein
MIYYILFLVISIAITGLLFIFLDNKLWALLFIAIATNFIWILPNVEGVSKKALAVVFLIMWLLYIYKIFLKKEIKPSQ